MSVDAFSNDERLRCIREYTLWIIGAFLNNLSDEAYEDRYFKTMLDGGNLLVAKMMKSISDRM